MLRAGILGATGYAGQELLRLLHQHDEIQVVKIISETHQGRRFDAVYRNFTGFTDAVCCEADYDTMADGLDVLFTSLPYGVLMSHLTGDLLDRVRVIDLGVDYRLMNRTEFLRYYGAEHKSIELASRFVYGQSEWNGDNVRAARHIANPGCFATAIELALTPLVREGLITSDVIVDGKCALTGAGRALSLGTHFAEANESAKPYKIACHPHAPESAKAIALFTGRSLNLTFVPHIVPMQRGILVSCYTTLDAEADDATVREIYDTYYGDKPFVRLLDKGMYVETKWVRASNMCHINFEIDRDSNRLIVFAALDNLIKGAAGQAVQNLNLMFGFDETAALGGVPACL